MIVDRPILIELYHMGMSLARAKKIYHRNSVRYMDFMKKMRQPEKRKGMALFNAFILDCRKSMYRDRTATYASHGDLT